MALAVGDYPTIVRLVNRIDLFLNAADDGILLLGNLQVEQGK